MFCLLKNGGSGNYQELVSRRDFSTGWLQCHSLVICQFFKVGCSFHDELSAIRDLIRCEYELGW
jgi:hypothetical protein